MLDERAGGEVGAGQEDGRLQEQRTGRSSGQAGGQDTHGGAQHPRGLQPHVQPFNIEVKKIKVNIR